MLHVVESEIPSLIFTKSQREKKVARTWQYWENSQLQENNWKYHLVTDPRQSRGSSDLQKDDA